MSRARGAELVSIHDGWFCSRNFKLDGPAIDEHLHGASAKAYLEDVDAQATCRAASAMLKYNTPAWGTALAWDRQRGGAGAAAGLTTSQFTDQRLFITGYARLNAWKLGAGWLRRDNEGTTAIAKTSDLAYVEAAYAVTPEFSLEAQVAKLDYRKRAAQATLFSLRGTYSLSKRSAVYATAGRINNNGPLALSASAGSAGGLPAAGMHQLGIALGLRHAF